MAFVPFLDRASWVKHSNVKGVLAAWRRRLKKGWVLGIRKLFLWLFGGILEKRGTDRFLRAASSF